MTTWIAEGMGVDTWEVMYEGPDSQLALFTFEHFGATRVEPQPGGGVLEVGRRYTWTRLRVLVDGVVTETRELWDEFVKPGDFVTEPA